MKAIGLGVAGAVVNRAVRVTSLPWVIESEVVAAKLGLKPSHVHIINDLVATGHGLRALPPSALVTLQEGTADEEACAGLIAAGTGLGETILVRVGVTHLPVPSEGGHADFAARTDREIELVKMLRERFGRAEVEQVLSGPGLVNLHRFTHRGGQCEMLEGVDETDAPARISQAGLSGRCQQCADALRMFVSAYGAEAGNLTLRTMATSGVYVGGGIAPKILPALKTGVFMEAFVTKEPMRELLERVPVKVILNPQAGLIGAAVHAQSLIQ